MTTEGLKTQEEFRAALLAKAAADDGFRAQLVDDPKAAIKEALGMDLPDSVSVQVHEESPLSAHLVLPPKASLSEADLEVITAGHSTGNPYNGGFWHSHGGGAEHM